MNTYNPVTYDFSEFGFRELQEAARLLTAYTERNETGYCLERFGDNVKIAMNKYSGFVWLEDEDYNCLMVNDNGELFQFYYLAYAGNEGSAEDLFEQFEDGEIDPEDFEQLADILEDEGKEYEAESDRNKNEKEKG